MQPKIEGFEVKAIQTEFKIGDDGPGILEGYCSIFGNEDRDGDIIQRGAFAEALKEFIDYGFLCYGHDWHNELGTIVDAKEDEKGLWIAAQFYSTPDAQNIRAKVAEKQNRGRPQQMSIGFRVAESERKKSIRHILKINPLFEASIVPVGSNPETRVTTVKAIVRDLDAETETRRAAIRRLVINHLVRKELPKCQ